MTKLFLTAKYCTINLFFYEVCGVLLLLQETSGNRNSLLGNTEYNMNLKFEKILGNQRAQCIILPIPDI